MLFRSSDCEVCRAEGFEARTRLEVILGDRHIIATLNMLRPDMAQADGVQTTLLAAGEASLSISAWQALGAAPGDSIRVAHPPTLDSLGAMRAKIYGHRLEASALSAIIGDVVAGHYSDIHLAAFLSACAGGRMDLQETIDLTGAMVSAGDRIDWEIGRAHV